MEGIIDYYEQPASNYREQFRAGYFYTAPIRYTIDSPVHYLKLGYFDKSKPYNSTYTIERIGIASLKPEEMYPVRELGLRSGEFVLMNPYKFRRVIVIPQYLGNFRGLKKQDDESFLVVPLYSTRKTNKDHKHTKSFINKCIAYKYPSLFFCPESSEFGARESLARIDKITFIHKSLLIPRPIKLTLDAEYCLASQIKHFLGEPLEGTICDYQEEVLE